MKIHSYPFIITTDFALDPSKGSCWLRGSAVEHQSLASVLSLSCAQPVADG